MKKIILLALIVPMVNVVMSQPVTEVRRDTLVNVDTATIAFNSIGSRLKAIDFLVQKVSGTVGGKVYLQASNNGGISWDNLDSLTNSNQATNTKHIAFTKTDYKSYRAYYTTSGTQNSILIVAYLRRPDE